ncbi:hypothetical protein [Pedobacter sp. SYP-B3415]|uniref:hypothetical protein n=1 Tax=Pedobacter sp. SYP-B3415 TaxID=2496641 RepID=UPI00101DD8EA|nr:hypothetical protein [Pedobacter sp. SYP-B3415]
MNCTKACPKALLYLILPAILVCSLKAVGQTNGKINIGLVYPLSTGGQSSVRDTNILSVHVLVGVSAAERGLAFAGLSNVSRHESAGIRFASLSNHSGGRTSGLQFAGLVNTSGAAKGISFAGLANLSKNLEGMQFAGLFNKALASRGMQVAGFANLAKDMRGVQLASFANIAGNVDGFQMAAFLNVAHRVNGVQLSGFINIATHSDYPLGLINLIKDGQKSVGASIDETETIMLNFKSGGRVLYGILGVGYNLKNAEETYAFEGGFGAHLLSSREFRLDLEATAQSLENFRSGNYLRSAVKVLPAFQTGPVAIFGGPTFNYLTTNTTEGKELFRHHLHTWNGNNARNFQALYVGYTAGLQVQF